MTATIQLAKPYTPKKLEEWVYISEKLDGVPIVVTVTAKGWTAETRQGEAVPSCANLCQQLYENLQSRAFADTLVFVGEVTHATLHDFKDVSGVVRRQSVQKDLVLNLFDYYDGLEEPFCDRAVKLAVCNWFFDGVDIRVIPQYYVRRDDVELEFVALLPAGAEGGVIRNPSDKWAPGKRTWGYQKYVKDPTLDLWAWGATEAVSDTGVGLGMVGAVLVGYRGELVPVGAGKLTHEERRELWATTNVHGQFVKDRMCTIKHKRDESYTGLRQPTFQHWRDDKDEADA